MLIEEYQKFTKTTAIYPSEPNLALPYLVHGLISEFGELLESIEEEFEDNGLNITPNPRHEITKEMGDILWYIARILDELDVSFSYFVTFCFKSFIEEEDDEETKNNLFLGAEEIESFEDIYKFCYEDLAYRIKIGNAGDSFLYMVHKSFLCAFHQCSKISGIIKKFVRDNTSLESITPPIKNHLATLFLAFLQLVFLYNISLENIAQVNFLKLSDRKGKNTLSGSGDAR